MNIELTKPEIDVVVALMDAGVKAAGLQAVRPEVLSVITKITEAVNAANVPAVPDSVPSPAS